LRSSRPCPNCATASAGHSHGSRLPESPVLGTDGFPLSAEIRAYFEPRFGHDFSKVRIHTYDRAAQSAAALNASAYTVGSDIAFASGLYAPITAAGRRLLAHELAHVVQQAPGCAARGDGVAIDPSATAEREAEAAAEQVIRTAPDASDRARPALTPLGPSLQSSPMLQRQERCSSTSTCATPDACAEPDRPGTGTSTTWTLIVNVDIEEGSWESALRNTNFGHTYLRFVEGSGRQYTYGFYPARELPNENRRSVPGCVRHPDTTHDVCIDDRLMYTLSRERYEAALARAQEICRRGGTYGQSYTCTTFADQVVRAAGQSMPASASEPTTVYMQGVPSIDNPNTLLENIRAERERDPAKRGPFWNNPCVNRCESRFEECLSTPRRGIGSGLFGGLPSPLTPQYCIIDRQRCLGACPRPS
jgi:hypothetical protein